MVTVSAVACEARGVHLCKQRVQEKNAALISSDNNVYLEHASKNDGIRRAKVEEWLNKWVME